MLDHHSFPQALPPRLGLVVGAGLLLQTFFGLDTDGARPFPQHALRAQGAGLTGGGGKYEASSRTGFGRAIVVRRLPRRTAHFLLLNPFHPRSICAIIRPTDRVFATGATGRNQRQIAFTWGSFLTHSDNGQVTLRFGGYRKCESVSLP